MKKLVLTLGAILAVAAAQANAETVVTDTDGNGVYSMEELVAAYPDLTEETFAAIDANADGSVDADELQAAVEAGTIAG
ncbi:EF-hand domain-containing protein [Ostreiculturibacter nitratireducens]|uniref:EF-hand domain-containing protein n=1 Tax=Ostreiculturibacter nitratireducens TaxID=3075226 RepID=UPI0031B5E529